MSRSPSPPRYRANVTPGKRLFVIGHRDIKENEYRAAFEQYGKVVDMWMVKNHRQGGSESKGIVYVTFAKISEAALAIEELNGKPIGEDQKYIKVIVASDKKDGSMHEANEDERFHRLFIMMKTDETEDSVRDTFGAYGKVTDIMVIKDRNTSQKKLAFVKFDSRYSAALALESCDTVYRAVFAKPKGSRADVRTGREGYDGDRNRGQKRSRYDSRDSYSLGRDNAMPYDQSYGGGGASSNPYPNFAVPPVGMFKSSGQSGISLLHVTVSSNLSEPNLRRLFDIVPGLLSVKFDVNSGIAFVKYTSTEYANYAVEKLNGFEYPAGHCLIVRLSNEQIDGCDSNGDQLQRAALVLQQAGINPSTVLAVETQTSTQQTDSLEKVPYCEVGLPLRQCMKPNDTPIVKRLFIVCQPVVIPLDYLRDVFCRFGDLVDIYLIPDRNFGYVKFASESSANTARDWLHMKNVNGCRLKVIDAEERGGQPSDRPYKEDGFLGG